MKKIIALALALITLFSAAFFVSRTYKVNKTRYYVEAYCELNNKELNFTFCGHNFVWELEKGDKIPSDEIVLLLMDNNGTENYINDDIIIKYK